MKGSFSSFFCAKYVLLLNPMFGLRKKPVKKMEFEPAPDVMEIVHEVVGSLPMPHIKLQNIHTVRSSYSKARAYARVWGTARIFHEAAGIPPTYVIEVLSHYYDKLPETEKIKVIIHELMHIPKTFSGALLSHKGPHHAINKRTVDKVYERLSEKG